MSSKPSTIPQFDTTSANLVTPSGTRLANGFATGGTPLPSGELNFLAHWFGEWCKYVSDGDLTLADVHLTGLNIGAASNVVIANASQNDLDFGGTFVGGCLFALTGGGSSAKITGIDKADAENEGRIICVINNTGTPVLWSIEDSGSSAANRIDCNDVPSGGLVTMPFKGCMWFRYSDGPTGRWSVIASSFTIDYTTRTVPGTLTVPCYLANAPHLAKTDSGAFMLTTAVTGVLGAIPLALPVGAVITAYRLYANKASAATTTILSKLQCVSGLNGSATYSSAGTGTESSNANAPGFIVLSLTGLSQTVVHGDTWQLELRQGTATATDAFYSAEVDYKISVFSAG